jgi:hypothetical protein
VGAMSDDEVRAVLQEGMARAAAKGANNG